MFQTPGRSLLILLLMLVALPQAVLGQEPGEISKNQAAAVPDTLRGWDMSWVAGLNIAQAAYSNWSRGGVNSYNLTSNSQLKLMYKRGRFAYDLHLTTRYGQARIQDEGVRKTEDQLRIRNRFLYDIGDGGEDFKLFGDFNFQTQYTEGFDYGAGPEGGNVLISDFFSPATFNQNAGLAYFPGTDFSLEAGLGLKQTVIKDTTLSTRYGLDPGQTFRMEAGIALGINFEREIMEDVSYYAYIETFTNAFRAIRETNVFFTNQFKGKVNSHINVLFQLDLVYDPDFSRRMQLAQTFSAGLSLNIY